MSKEEQEPQWEEVEASLSGAKKDWISPFKRKYHFIIMLWGYYLRDLTSKEKETGIYPERTAFIITRI